MKKKDNLYCSIDQLSAKCKNSSNYKLINLADKYADELLKTDKQYKLAVASNAVSAITSLGGFATFLIASNPIVMSIALGVGTVGMIGTAMSIGLLKRNVKRTLFLINASDEVLKELRLRLAQAEDKEAKEIFKDVLVENNEEMEK